MSGARLGVAVISAVAVMAGALINVAWASAATTALSASLSSVQVNPIDVVGGSPATGTVTLTSAAPSGGFQVPLTSDNTAVATVPASVTVSAGATSATFVVSTTTVTTSQSALIIGTTPTVTTYAIITVRTAFSFSNGSISIIPGGSGSGIITSQPAGINCNTNGTGAGACSAFFPAGTVVRLNAKANAGSSFQGWRGLPGCGDPSKITVSRGSNISCQPSFTLT